MSSDLLRQYEEAMLQKRDAQAKLDSIKAQVMDEVRAHGSQERNGERIRLPGHHGNFLILNSFKYEYSEAVDRLMVELTLLKNKERQNNIAKKVASEMLMFKQSV